MRVRLLLMMATVSELTALRAGAGPWSIEPRLGVSAEYSSNPLLREFDPNPEEHIAALVDFPLRYDSDAIDILFRPSGRVSDSRGYSSLASDYAHVDSSAQFNDELGATTLQASLARDSSLYYVGGLLSGVGVRRDTEATSADWTHATSERGQVQLDASWSHVRYSAPQELDTLTDYRYTSAGPTFSYAISERNTLKLLGTYGLYRSLNGITESTSENGDLGLVSQLTEIWTLSATAGYSHSKNAEKVFFGPFLLGTFEADQNSAVYAATLARQGERVTLSVGASRALQPTGLAYLSRQDSVNLNAGYVHTERLDFSVSASWLRALNPETSGGILSSSRTATVRYLNAGVNANWHLTPQWTVSMHATRLTQQVGPPTISAASTGFSVDLSRQFLRTQF